MSVKGGHLLQTVKWRGRELALWLLQTVSGSERCGEEHWYKKGV